MIKIVFSIFLVLIPSLSTRKLLLAILAALNVSNSAAFTCYNILDVLKFFNSNDAITNVGVPGNYVSVSQVISKAKSSPARRGFLKALTIMGYREDGKGGLVSATPIEIASGAIRHYDDTKVPVGERVLPYCAFCESEASLISEIPENWRPIVPSSKLLMRSTFPIEINDSSLPFATYLKAIGEGKIYINNFHDVAGHAGSLLVNPEYRNHLRIAIQRWSRGAMTPLQNRRLYFIHEALVLPSVENITEMGYHPIFEGQRDKTLTDFVEYYGSLEWEGVLNRAQELGAKFEHMFDYFGGGSFNHFETAGWVHGNRMSARSLASMRDTLSNTQTPTASIFAVSSESGFKVRAPYFTQNFPHMGKELRELIELLVLATQEKSEIDAPSIGYTLKHLNAWRTQYGYSEADLWLLTGLGDLSFINRAQALSVAIAQYVARMDYLIYRAKEFSVDSAINELMETEQAEPQGGFLQTLAEVRGRNSAIYNFLYRRNE